MSVFLWSWGFLAFVIGYGFVAGRVFRALDPPERCDGTAIAVGFTHLECSQSLSSSCAACAARNKKLAGSWLWPLAPVLMLPRLVFRLASDVETRPQIEEEREKVHR